MQNLNQVFTALSDNTRRNILAQLVSGETSLSNIAKPFEMSQTAVSKHVSVLEQAGLVNITKRGHTRFCRLDAAPMKDATQWLKTYESFWLGQFDALAKHLKDNP